MFERVNSAIAFAAIAHSGQVRKYDGLPYVTHPIAVMEIFFTHASISTEDEMIAAVLHDTVEDTFVKISDIERRFGSTVASLVFDLTDQFVLPEQGNRAQRKTLERERLAKISPAAQSIKYADLIHNTASIVPNDPGFAGTYLREKEALLAIMREGDATLLAMAEKSLAIGQTHLMHLKLENKNGFTASPRPPAPRPDRVADDAASVPGLAGVASITR
jgi:hypothetical protein